MTENTVTVEATEERVYTSRENRVYARRLLVGKAGMTKAEQVERMEKAQAALAKAIEQVKAEVAEEEATVQKALGTSDVENYDADELEAYQASF